MSTRSKALLAVITGNTIFGFSFLFSKLALQVAHPSVLLAVRFFCAFLVLNVLVLIGRAFNVKALSFSLKGKPLKYILLLAIFQPVLYFLCETYGIVYTSSAYAGTIIAVVPLAGVIFDILILHADVGRKQVICALLSIVGVVITSIGAEGMKSSFLGTLILLGAVVSGALFYVFSQKSGEDFNPLEQTYVMFAAGTVVYGIYAMIQCGGDFDTQILGALMLPRFYIGISYLSVLSSVVAFMCLNYGTARITVSEASIFANLTTVISILAGVIILGEIFTLQQIIGAAIILIAVYLSSRTT